MEQNPVFEKVVQHIEGARGELLELCLQLGNTSSPHGQGAGRWAGGGRLVETISCRRPTAVHHRAKRQRRCNDSGKRRWHQSYF